MRANYRHEKDEISWVSSFPIMKGIGESKFCRIPITFNVPIMFKQPIMKVMVKLESVPLVHLRKVKRLKHCKILPISTIERRWITTIISTFMTVVRRWETIHVVLFIIILLRASWTTFSYSISKALVASSRRRIRGSFKIALAITIFVFGLQIIGYHALPPLYQNHGNNSYNC